MLALIVDGLNLVRRIYAAVPGEQGDGQHDEDVLRSIGRSVERAVHTLSPTHGVAAFDAPGPNWRHTLLADYKKDRPPMPQALQTLMPRIEEVFTETGIRCVRVEGFEADDVVATVATAIAARAGKAVILSTDKSMLSLLREGIEVRNHFEDQVLDTQYTRERFGVLPTQIPDYLALVGERSQSIPGVKSIGKKTAAKLLAEHGDINGILNAATTMSGRTGSALRDGAKDAMLFLQILTLQTDVAIGLNLSECRMPQQHAKEDGSHTVEPQ